MTMDELRAFCLGLAGTHEKETWGDAEHAGDVTFRVKDKIYLITGQEGGSASIRTDKAQQTDLIAAFPEAVSVAPYVGRFGWVNVQLDGLGRERAGLRAETQRLRAELSSVAANAQIEKRARTELGLVEADPITTRYVDLSARR